tara:strand:+ start:366 stop:587 length:222 start_codon:yes stop_codon:yes gene_type:complete
MLNEKSYFIGVTRLERDRERLDRPAVPDNEKEFLFESQTIKRAGPGAVDKPKISIICPFENPWLGRVIAISSD